MSGFIDRPKKTQGSVLPFEGEILQVVQTQSQTGTTSTTAGYTAAGWDLAITPKYASSNVLVMWNYSFFCESPDSNFGVGVRIYRSAPNAAYLTDSSNSQLYFYQGGHEPNAVQLGHLVSGMYLDSPATLSACTYQIHNGGTLGGAISVTSQWGSSDSSLTLFEIGG